MRTSQHAATKAFVEAYYRAAYGECENIIGSVPKSSPERPHCEAVLSMALAYDWRSPEVRQVDAIAKFRSVQDSPPGDVGLFRAELMAAVRLFYRERQIGEGLRCLRLLRQISEAGASSLVRANVLHCEAAMAYIQGGMSAARNAYLEACALKVPRSCNLWYILRLGLCLAAMETCHWGESERVLAEVEARPPSDAGLRDMLALRRARLFVIRGESRKGLAFLNSLPPPASSYFVWMRIAYRLRLLVGADRLSEAQSLLDSESRELPEFEREFLQARICLHNGDLAGVREHASRSMLSGRRGTLAVLDNVSLLLAAELSAGRLAAARSLLRMVDTDGNQTSMETPRIVLLFLEGRRAEAARLFRRILEVNDAAFLRESLYDCWGLTANQAATLWRLAEELDEQETGAPPVASSGSAEASPGPRLLQRADLVGDSPAMGEVRARIERYAPLPETVLVTGETGTGKELVARLLHEKSPRADRPFIAVNCAAISDALIESELFGHVRGAFTGAERDHEGLFEAAADGTIFLDEISSMSPRLQGTLLRVLENGEIRPVGSSKPRRVKARVIAASNQPLDALVGRGEFRSDLYYRLARLNIDIPPLRERPEDIPELVRHFLSAIYGSGGAVVSEELLTELKARPWPGNVRELRNEVERLVLLAGGGPLSGVKALERAGPAEGTAAAAPVVAAGAAGKGGRRRARDPLRTLRELFSQERELTRAEVADRLGCAPNSATSYLKRLEREGLIERVHTSASLRTSYFALRAPAAGPYPGRQPTEA